MHTHISLLAGGLTGFPWLGGRRGQEKPPRLWLSLPGKWLPWGSGLNSGSELVTSASLSSIFTPILAGWQFPEAPRGWKDPGKALQGIMVQTRGTRWIWQPQDLPCNHGSRVPGTHTGHTWALSTVPPGVQHFFPHLQKIPRFILASTSQEHPKRNPSRSFICTGTLSRPWNVLPK